MIDISLRYIIFHGQPWQYVKKGIIWFCMHIDRYLQYRLIYSPIYHPMISVDSVYFFSNYVFNLEINLVFISNIIPMY